jgi:transcriptional regulator with GAF, ATPase, and Fis domain
MSQPDQTSDLLTLTAQPSVTVKQVLTLALEQALSASSADAALIVLNPLLCQDENTCLPRIESSQTFARLESFWQIVPGTPSSIRAYNPWQKTIRENERTLYFLLCSRSFAPRAESNSIDSVLEKVSFNWVLLFDGQKPIAWFGLGVDKRKAAQGRPLRLSPEFLSQAAATLNRLFLKLYWQRQGIDINLVGISRAFLNFESKLWQVALHNNCPVLIRGERGSGKELAAYAVHYFSERRKKPLVPILAAGLSESLQVDELFGHEKHAFTGAANFRKGKFLAANGGTVFLDEIGDLPQALQVTLLRVIERGEIQPIGRDMPKRVDVRIIAATNKDLTKLVEDRIIRADLYDRLSVVILEVPPLRERREDIPLLANYFLLKQCLEVYRCASLTEEICRQCHRQQRLAGATSDFWQTLCEYDWPGNVRELENLIILLSTLPDETMLDVLHLPRYILEGLEKKHGRVSNDNQLTELQTLNVVMRKHIEGVLSRTGNNQTEAARILGIARTTLQARMKKLGIKNF